LNPFLNEKKVDKIANFEQTLPTDFALFTQYILPVLQHRSLTRLSWWKINRVIVTYKYRDDVDNCRDIHSIDKIRISFAICLL